MALAILLQIILLFIAPVFIIRYHIIHPKNRIVLFFAIPFAAFVIMLVERWSLANIGLRTDTLIPALLPYTLFTIASAIGIILYAKALKRKPQQQIWKHWHFQYGGFLILAFLQQFLFQGFLMHQLQKLAFSPLLIVIITTFLFVFIHSIYTDFREGLPLAIIGGAAFALLYLAYQNLIVATLSHTVLNFIAARYRFFTKV